MKGHKEFRAVGILGGRKGCWFHQNYNISKGWLQRAIWITGISSVNHSYSKVVLLSRIILKPLAHKIFLFLSVKQLSENNLTNRYFSEISIYNDVGLNIMKVRICQGTLVWRSQWHSKKREFSKSQIKTNPFPSLFFPSLLLSDELGCHTLQYFTNFVNW